MSFTVTKMAPKLVSPSVPTPSGYLSFSAEDRKMPLAFVVPVVLVFRQGKKHAAAKVIREAVANSLVPYYPVAGRIAAHPDDGELGIACTGEGVWFVEASADCRLESLGDVNLYVQEQSLFDLSKDQLLPSPPQQVDHALPLTMQVTEFKCGGFTVGIIFSHAMFDGIGVGQFMVAVGEMARGLPEPTVKPVWCRDVIPRLVPVPSPDTEPPPTCQRSYTADLSLDRIDQLKAEFEKETGEKCTTFDVVTAIFWRCRTRAIGLRPDLDVRLTYSADVRSILRDKLLLPPEGGYYGNCFNLVLLKATAGKIANASIFDIVSLVREAKGNVGAECSRWLEGIGGTPMPPFSYPNVFLTDWRRLGFFEADYGWGAPEYVVPLDEHPAIILNSPAPVKGVRLRTVCIAHGHFEAFRSHLSEYMARN